MTPIPDRSALSPHQFAGTVLDSLTKITLFVVAIVAAVGAMPLTTASYLAIGLGSASVLAKLSKQSCQRALAFNLIDTAFCITVISLGVLGASGVLSTQAIGQGVLYSMTAIFFPLVALQKKGCATVS